MTKPENEIERFSLSGGGIFERLFPRLGIKSRPLLWASILTAVAWVPLLGLAAIEGRVLGSAVQMPFLQDYGVYGRILVAIPVLVLAKIPIDLRTREILRQFLTTNLTRPEDLPVLSSAVATAAKRKGSRLAEVAILVLAYSIVGVRAESARSDLLTTWYYTDGGVTVAGWYFVLVSLPMFQFLFGQWLWRLLIWGILLAKISRLKLQLMPVHPDRTGGLGFLGLGQIPFGLLGFAGGAVIGAYLVNSMIYREYSLDDATRIMFIYLILAVGVLLAPLFSFTLKLVLLRVSGIFRYGDFGEDYARFFDRKWVAARPRDESLLGTSDIQSLADLANSYAIVQNMRIIPVDRKTLAVIAVLAAIPMAPVFFVALPFKEVIARVLGIFG